MIDFRRLFAANDRHPEPGAGLNAKTDHDAREQIKQALHRRIDEIRSLQDEVGHETSFYGRYLLSKDIQSRYELVGMLWHQYRLLGRNTKAGLPVSQDGKDNKPSSSSYNKKVI